MRLNLRILSLLAVLALAVSLWKPINHRLDERLVLRAETLDEAAFQDLINKSPDERMVLIKAWHSGKIPHRQAVVRYLKESSDPQFRSPETDKILVTAARDGDSNVREIAFAALAARKHPLLLPLVGSQLHDPDPNLRLLALEYARNQLTNAAAPLIAAALRDIDPVVAATAAVALQRLSGQDFGIRVAQVLDDKLNSQSRQAFETKLAQAKQWWSIHQKSFGAWPATELPPLDPAFEVSDFALQDLNGKTVRLSDFVEKRSS
jgi:hypothetical protein